MDRKQFLKHSGCGLCSCLAANVMMLSNSSAAELDSAEDWKIRFVKKRYAKLIEILSERVDEKNLDGVLYELGKYCAATSESLGKFQGDFEGFRDHMKQYGEVASYDREKGMITLTSPERTDCFCPLISVQYHTPAVVCNCSLGWQQKTWETVTGKAVQVQLKESVLRGGNRCIFQITVMNEK
jgi:predicted ArsR family transcriptional regulator